MVPRGVLVSIGLLGAFSSSACGRPAASTEQGQAHTPGLFVLSSRSAALATGDDPIIVTSYLRGADGRVSNAPITFDPSGAVPEGLHGDRYGVQVGTVTSTTVGQQTITASGGGLSGQASVSFEPPTPWRPVALNLSGNPGILSIDPTDPDILDLTPSDVTPIPVYETVNGGLNWTLRFSATPTPGPSFTGDAAAYLFNYIAADPFNAGVYLVSGLSNPTLPPNTCLQRSTDWGRHLERQRLLPGPREPGVR